MILSDRTMKILSMCSKINKEIYIHKGSRIRSIKWDEHRRNYGVSKYPYFVRNILNVDIDENFPRDVYIQDLKSVLSVMRKMRNPNIEFHEKHILLKKDKDEIKINTELPWHFDENCEEAKKKLKETQEYMDKELCMDELSLSFYLSKELLIDCVKFIKSIRQPKLVIYYCEIADRLFGKVVEGNRHGYWGTENIDDPDKETFTLNLGKIDKEFRFDGYIVIETTHLRKLPVEDYNVKISFREDKDIGGYAFFESLDTYIKFSCLIEDSGYRHYVDTKPRKSNYMGELKMTT